MPASFNQVIIVGTLTRDIELKYTQSGTAVCEVTLAINRAYKDANNQKQEETTFVDVTVWGRTAEVMNEYLGKGSSCLIDGRLTLDQWEDKETGQKRSKLKVTANSMQMLGGGNGSQQGGHGRPAGQQQQQRGQGRDTSQQAYFDDPHGNDVPF